jgi:hypothetical protein
MSFLSDFRLLAVALAIPGLLLPPFSTATAAAAEAQRPPGRPPEAARPLVHDVELTEQGTLEGCVVDQDGMTLAAAPVILMRQEREAARVATDRQGAFSVGGLRGGVYTIVVDTDACVCRVWSAGTGPPHAGRQLLIVRGEQVERGQMPFHCLFPQGPVLAGLVVAAAIAIPVAIHNSSGDSASGS